MTAYQIFDITCDPRYNPTTDAAPWRKKLTTCVTDKVVILAADNKPSCITHKAMNAVNPNCSIWRCLACHRGCYAVKTS